MTQPAVSLQIRSLEQRLGRQLLDRSGRRVEPTEAGLRALRVCTAAPRARGASPRRAPGRRRGRGHRDARARGLDRPRRHRRAAPALRVPASSTRTSRVAPAVSDTQTLVDQVANRELELGIVGAARRHRGVTFEPFFRDEVVLACPAGHRLAGKTISLDDLKNEQLIVMQEGAGVRQVIEDELRKAGLRLRDLDVSARARPPGVGAERSPRPATASTFISRLAVEADLAAGPCRDGARARARSGARDLPRRARSGRSRDPRRAGVRRVRAGTAARMIVRWGLAELPKVLGELGIEAAAARRECALGRSTCRRADGGALDRGAFGAGRCGARSTAATACSRSAAAARSISARPSPPRPALPVVSVPTTYAGAEWTPFFGMRDPERRMRGGGVGAQLAGGRLRAGADARASAPGDGRYRDERARALRRGAVRRGAQPDGGRARPRRGAKLIGDWLPRVVARPQDLGARKKLLKGAMHAGMALGGLDARPRPRDGAGPRRPLRPAARRDERAQPAAGAALQRRRRARTPCAASARRSDADDPAARVEELARLGGSERLRDFGVPEDELPRSPARRPQRAGREGEPAAGDRGGGREPAALDLVNNDS